MAAAELLGVATPGDLAAASAVVAVLGGVAGIITALATRSRSATEGFRDLVDRLQEERDEARTEAAATTAELRRVEGICWRHGWDPTVDAPARTVHPGQEPR